MSKHLTGQRKRGEEKVLQPFSKRNAVLGGPLRKLAAALVLLLLPALLLTGCGEDRSYSVDRVQIAAKLGTDGDLYVEELFTFTFQGAYSRTSRYLDARKEGDVTFFEAYEPPADRTLGQYGYKGLTRLPVEWEASSGTFYVEQPAKDETRSVYYRYRIPGAAVRYADTALLDWSFLADNNTDLHEVSLELTLPGTSEPPNAYLYDRTGGTLTRTANGKLRYENAKLLSQENARMTVYLPAEALAEAPLQHEALGIAERIGKEEAYAGRLADRERRLASIRDVAVLLNYTLVAAIAYQVLHPFLAGLGSRESARERAERMDPVRLVYLYRNGRLRFGDTLAGIFSLERRGLITMRRVPAKERFQADDKAPSELPEFRFAGISSKLGAADLHLVQWLFRQRSEQGGHVLSLDSVSGPTRTERKQKKHAGKYVQRGRRFARQFTTWMQLLEQNPEQAPPLGVHPVLRAGVPALAVLHLGLVLWLFDADGASPKSLLLAAVLLGVLGIAASYLYRKRGVMTAFLIGCFVAAANLIDETAVMPYLYGVLLSLLLLWLLPKLRFSREEAADRRAILAWRRSLAAGGQLDRREADRAADRVGRMTQDAILLGVASPFLRRLKRRHPGLAAAAAERTPLADPAMADALAYVSGSWSGVALGSSGSSSGDSSSDSGSWSSDSGGGGGGGDGGTGAD
ncbi:hypothetical protein J31TS4_44840 [Paenibacillus sp. J31TS4]|uniref:DUF2207 domain-containing protein n=1 Tax=Paenibacillus sp. J31TS4 TaxID=2807195 RepID=UPI001B02AE12|nr:DUF2207 domain-containing protein [Paenibacillus sp. J31TS4]GIP41204.1 hypothetical protein J31TS4_44840 [Paenibacillus sp. J31TS4]